MKKRIVLAVALLISTFSTWAHSYAVLDSIGIERVGDKVFVLHKVEPGETLFSMFRRYGTPVDDIKKANPGSEQGISVGSILKIPYYKTIKATASSATATPKSNNGTIKKHTVQKSEGLFAIARQYQVTVDELKKWNNLSTSELALGQELIVSDPNLMPSKPTVATNVAANQPTTSGQAEGKLVHTVDVSQTLYSISRMYNTTIDQLKAWNNLPNVDISVGQQLIVGVKETEPVRTNPNPVVETKTKPEEKKPVVSEPTKTNPVVQAKPQETKPTVTNPAAAKENETDKSDEPTGLSSFKKVSQNGIAELIEGSNDSNKYRALHRTAPIGTIMHVRNDLNDMSVFVRVVGKLPDTGVNDKVVIKISKAAFDKLGGVNSRFPVEITYQP